MLEDAAGIRRVVLACGSVDIRKGIDGLSVIIGDKYRQNPFEKGTLFLFCGRKADRIKGLLWMGNGFLLLYKRFESGSLSWPRTTEEAADLTEEQYHYLMLGLYPLDFTVTFITFQEPLVFSFQIWYFGNRKVWNPIYTSRIQVSSVISAARHRFNFHNI